MAGIYEFENFILECGPRISLRGSLHRQAGENNRYPCEILVEVNMLLSEFNRSKKTGSTVDCWDNIDIDYNAPLKCANCDICRLKKVSSLIF